MGAVGIPKEGAAARFVAGWRRMTGKGGTPPSFVWLYAGQVTDACAI
jgi:hypothetical protein